MSEAGIAMRRTVAVGLLAPLLFTAAGCGSGDGKNAEDRAERTCRTLLGEDGVAWAETHSPQEAGPEQAEDVASAKDRFYRDARSWTADAEQAPPRSDTEVCRIGMRAANPYKRRLSLSYGASTFPFDFPFGEKVSEGVPQVVFPVSSDVKLVARQLNGFTAYFVYVKCLVPGAPAGQENGAPLQGALTDSLVNNAGLREYLTYLLRSAGTVAKQFGCRNRPVVPATLPKP
ncbi:hypothetical protein ACL02U_17970 [Streptomyces sp. MS06]|uniref:hypothetical protein n=1 Tax=Streptomyces sp. MS06 TaxID=3385974 RepID=UPI0039A2498C